MSVRDCICLNCGKTFQTKHAGKYCSTDCMKIHYKTRLKGENNPNYTHGIKHCEKCGREISRNAKKLCLTCRDMNGENNPYFGKQHSNEIKQHMASVWDNTHDNKHWLGRKHKASSRQKMSIAQKKEWQEMNEDQRKIRLETLRRICSDQLNFKPTVPENKVAAILDSKGIKYQRNAFLYNKFFVDFLLEDGRIIEVFGDFWHGNPLVYPEPTTKQLRQQLKDKSRLAYLKKCGREVIVVWENRDGRNNHIKMENFVRQLI